MKHSLKVLCLEQITVQLICQMDPSSDTRNINLGPNQMALKDHSKVKKN
jgi:hypothetical protein